MSDHADTIRRALTKGYHEQGHHPNCATREDEGCDCYARGSYEARAALDALLAERQQAVDALKRVMEKSIISSAIPAERNGELLAALDNARDLLVRLGEKP